MNGKADVALQSVSVSAGKLLRAIENRNRTFSNCSAGMLGRPSPRLLEVTDSQHHFSTTWTMKFKVVLVVLVALGFCRVHYHASGRDASRDAFFENHTIPCIRIQIEPPAVASLENRMREYVKATVYEG